jgi:hypothetical protein
MKNTITVVTTFSKENWNAYANRSIPTWLTYFDSAVNFHFHCEWQPIYDSRINYINPSDEKENFLSRNYLIDRKYNKNRKNQGYTTRWDVYCHKVFAQCESALIAETDLLLFLDADVACISPITSEILFEFIENNFCGYVGRTSPGTETGFLLYNLTKDPDKKFFKEFLEIYTGDKIFDFDQWDDCFIFDHCRSNSSLSFKNLSGQYTNFLDPIAVGPLGEFFDHWLSKKSKRQGSSKFRKFRGKI